MLILTRRLTETLVIGDNVNLTVLDIKGSRVRLGVNAPRDVLVMREEASQKTKAGHRLPNPSP